jgi:hypothetical protein
MVNPTAPGGEMLGERSPDSVLFDIKTLDGGNEEQATARAGKGTPVDEEASGLIDVKKVLADTPEEHDPTPVVERLASPMPAVPEPVPEPSSDRARTVILLASMLTLLVVGVLLAMKAMG